MSLNCEDFAKEELKRLRNLQNLLLALVVLLGGDIESLDLED